MAEKLDNMTFLIGGMFSTGERHAQVRFSAGYLEAINWYKNLEYEENFNAKAANHWKDVYGNNTDGMNGERYFWWRNTQNITYRNIKAAADRLIERINWARENHGSTNFRVRLIGHSAGCLVANVASHHMQPDSISQLILCAPPVPNSRFALRRWYGRIDEALPKLESLQENHFYYIDVINDWVLNLFAFNGVRKRYDIRFIRRAYPDVARRAMNPPSDTLEYGDHWAPVQVDHFWDDDDKYIDWIESH